MSDNGGWIPKAATTDRCVVANWAAMRALNGCLSSGVGATSCPLARNTPNP